jgi:hypothetical protein
MAIEARDMAEATPGQCDGKTGKQSGATPGEWNRNLRQQQRGGRQPTQDGQREAAIIDEQAKDFA